jgi:4-methyl-5(b-hydroxyethyl)-thiazole monophosphate biosynthesis
VSKRVLVPLAPGFEEVEALAPVDLLRRAGCQVVTASVGAPNPIVGRNRIRVMADLDLAEALAEWGDAWDLVLLPGGAKGTENLEADEGLLGLLTRRLAAGGLTAAICAAPRVLAAAGLARSVAVTGHPGCRGDLADFADYREEAVVRAGHVITSRGPGTAMALGLACVEALCGPAVAAKVRAETVA